MSLADDLRKHDEGRGRRRHVRPTAFTFHRHDGPTRVHWNPANRRFHKICEDLPRPLTDALREEIKRRHEVSSWTHLDAETIHEWADWMEAHGELGRQQKAARDLIDEAFDDAA